MPRGSLQVITSHSCSFSVAAQMSGAALLTSLHMSLFCMPMCKPCSTACLLYVLSSSNMLPANRTASEDMCRK